MKKKFIDFLLIIIGTFILACSVEYFILPFSILSGGVAGIAVAIEPFFHWNETLVANILVISLLLIGRIFLGKQFMYTTLLSSLAYPVFTTLLSMNPIEMDIDPMLASLYAGLLGGIGIGLVMRTGASTGGMDIPPLVLHKLTGVKVSTLVMITDALTVLIGIMSRGLSAALIGLISVASSGYGIARVLESGQGGSAKSV
ncbi:MAG: YitT family protein, partial [Solobacterium sp.]|nr:YitT family protein [Solobacterium sp.]